MGVKFATELQMLLTKTKKCGNIKVWGKEFDRFSPYKLAQCVAEDARYKTREPTAKVQGQLVGLPLFCVVGTLVDQIRRLKRLKVEIYPPRG